MNDKEWAEFCAKYERGHPLREKLEESRATDKSPDQATVTATLEALIRQRGRPIE